MSTSQPASSLVDLDRGSPRPPRALKARRIAIRVVYALLSLMTLTMAMGLVGQLTGKIPDGPYGFGAGGSTAWKLLSLGGYLVIAWTAGRSVPAVQWVVVGQLAWLTADLVAPQDPSASPAGIVLQYVASTVLFLAPWLLLAPERRQVLSLRARPDRIALGLMAVVVPLAVLWARHSATLVIPAVDDQSAELRFDMVGLALVFAFVGVFASLRPRGARWLLGCVAATALYTGLLALLTQPTDLASPGRAGGLLLLVLGVAFAWRAAQGRFTADPG